HNEMGFALMAVNIRKYTAINTENGTFSPEDGKNACAYLFMINTSIFIYPRLVLSQPLSIMLRINTPHDVMLGSPLPIFPLCPLQAYVNESHLLKQIKELTVLRVKLR